MIRGEPKYGRLTVGNSTVSTRIVLRYGISEYIVGGILKIPSNATHLNPVIDTDVVDSVTARHTEGDGLILELKDCGFTGILLPLSSWTSYYVPNIEYV